MRLFRMETTTAAGRPWTSRAWYGELRDQHGHLRRLALFTDRSVSWAFLERCQSLIDCRRAGVEPTPSLQTWLSGLPSASIAKLVQFGFLAPTRLGQDRTLPQQRTDYLDALRSRGRDPRHVAIVDSILKALVQGTGVARLEELTVDRIYRYLADRRRHGAHPISATTCNHYIKTVRAWFRWMVQDQRIPADPLRGLVRLDAAHDRHRLRRALSAEELEHLCTTTTGAARRWNMTGADRALLYRFAALTGLRSGAIRSLRRASLDLKGEPPTVEAYSKRKRHRLPLRTDLLPALRELLGRRGPTEPLFTMPARANVARMLREDLAEAGIPLRDTSGRVVDFHALRRTFATQLYQAGVRPQLAQRLLGHSTVDLTTNLYTDIGMSDQVQAIEATQYPLGATKNKRLRRGVRRSARHSKARQEVTRPSPAKSRKGRKPRKKR